MVVSWKGMHIMFKMLSFDVLLRFVLLAYTLVSKCFAIKKDHIMDVSLIEYRVYQKKLSVELLH